MPTSESDIVNALVASMDCKVDCHKLAALLNTSFYSIETKIRKGHKKAAEAMIAKAKAEGRLDGDGKVIKTALPTGNGAKGTPKKGNGVKKEE